MRWVPIATDDILPSVHYHELVPKWTLASVLSGFSDKSWDQARGGQCENGCPELIDIALLLVSAMYNCLSSVCCAMFTPMNFCSKEMHLAYDVIMICSQTQPMFHLRHGSTCLGLKGMCYMYHQSSYMTLILLLPSLCSARSRMSFSFWSLAKFLRWMASLLIC